MWQSIYESCTQAFRSKKKKTGLMNGMLKLHHAACNATHTQPTGNSHGTLEHAVRLIRVSRVGTQRWDTMSLEPGGI